MERINARFVALVLVPGTILGLFFQLTVGSTFSADLGTLWVTFLLLWLLSSGVTLLMVIVKKWPLTLFLVAMMLLTAVIYRVGCGDGGDFLRGWSWFGESMWLSFLFVCLGLVLLPFAKAYYG